MTTRQVAFEEHPHQLPGHFAPDAHGSWHLFHARAAAACVYEDTVNGKTQRRPVSADIGVRTADQGVLWKDGNHGTALYGSAVLCRLVVCGAVCLKPACAQGRNALRTSTQV